MSQTDRRTTADEVSALVEHRWLLPAILVVAGTLIRIGQLGHSLNEAYSFRQAQTAYLAQSYADRGIDLFRSPLPIFGPHSDVPMEFPLVQAVGAVLVKAGLPSDAAMRLISLVGFQASAVMLLVLLTRYFGRRVGLVGLALFELLPFGLMWGASSLIEFPTVALAMAMVLALDAWFRDGRWWWLVAGSVCAWVAALVKITTMPSWTTLLGVSAVLTLMAAERRRPVVLRVVVGGIAGPAVGAGLALWWSHFADSVKEKDALTRFLMSDNLQDWNFGTWDQRTQWANWDTILHRVDQEILGVFGVTAAVAVVAAVLSRSWPTRVARVGWLLATLACPAIFFNLYVVHSYYLCAIYPLLVGAGAIAVDFVAGLARRWTRSWFLPAALVVILVWATTATSEFGAGDVRAWTADGGENFQGVAIRDNTDPDDWVIVIGCNWDSTTPYFADRGTMMLWSVQEADAHWAQTDDLDTYEYLFNCGTTEDPATYLPDDAVLEETGVPGLWGLHRAR